MRLKKAILPLAQLCQQPHYNKSTFVVDDLAIAEHRKKFSSDASFASYSRNIGFRRGAKMYKVVHVRQNDTDVELSTMMVSADIVEDEAAEFIMGGIFGKVLCEHVTPGRFSYPVLVDADVLDGDNSVAAAFQWDE